MTAGLRTVAAAVYGFIVGDDWRPAVGAVTVIVAVALLAEAGVNAWWLGPLALPLLLLWSLAGSRTEQ